MYLNELSVCVIGALLIKRRLRRSSAHNRIRRFAKDGPNPTSSNDHSIGWKGTYFHGAQIHGTNPAADALAIKNGGEELPGLELSYASFGFVPANLLIQGI